MNAPAMKPSLPATSSSAAIVSGRKNAGRWRKITMTTRTRMMTTKTRKRTVGGGARRRRSGGAPRRLQRSGAASVAGAEPRKARSRSKAARIRIAEAPGAAAAEIRATTTATTGSTEGRSASEATGLEAPTAAPGIWAAATTMTAWVSTTIWARTVVLSATRTCRCSHCLTGCIRATTTTKAVCTRCIQCIRSTRSILCTVCSAGHSLVAAVVGGVVVEGLRTSCTRS
mmetsp:Transcript_65779/g.176241  ORF Transcript_65779/g.176241 Transcript_65779/m.176241 type:complete len:228 (-) Transcript_65779:626-1309(-)